MSNLTSAATFTNTDTDTGVSLTVPDGLTTSETLEALAAVVAPVLEAKVETLYSAEMAAHPSGLNPRASRDLHTDVAMQVHNEFRRRLMDALYPED